MSADCHAPATLCPPYHVWLSPTLSETAQTTVRSLLELLPNNCIHDITLNESAVANSSALCVNSLVDGRGLACPMPLLKTKVALRTVPVGDSLYVVATDSNSQADITAFCQQTQQSNAAHPLLLIINQTTSQLSTDSVSPKASDTIFHFIITKTDSN